MYYSNKVARDTSGNTIARLDHDDTRGYGFETITFQMEPGDKFKYYVHWYAGDGTWGGSNAVVNLYKSTELIGSYPVPDVDLNGYEAGRYWYVFDLTDGLDPVKHDTITNNVPRLDTQNASSSMGVQYYQYYPMKLK